MFFRRGRLRAKHARSALIELFDNHYQWLLRMPVARLLAQGDASRFLCSLRFLVNYVGQGVYLLNHLRPPEQKPWFADDLRGAVADLPLRPSNLAGRLAQVMRLDDPALAEVEGRRLLLDVIDLAPREKKKGQEAEEQAPVPWLLQIAALEPQASDSGRADRPVERSELMPLARRAVRIVWRLPGSRLAALTGAVAADLADLTSDIDVSLFGLKLPQAPVRRSLIAATSDAPGDITQLSHKTFASDAFWLNGGLPGAGLRLINVRYFLIEEARRLFERPVPQSQADAELLAHLSTAEVLVDYEFRGPGLLHNLQRATRQARPERMAQAAAWLDQASTRLQNSTDGAAIFYHSVDAILALFQLLAARNDRWITLPKWTAAWLDSLEHAPAEAHQRLNAVALLPSRPENIPARIETLRALAHEIHAL
jgi:hypothetical protein